MTTTSVTVTSLAQSIYSVSSDALDDCKEKVTMEGYGVFLESNSDSTIAGQNWGMKDLDSEEPLGEYCYGGYHRGYVGEELGSDSEYVLLEKLGWGGYCTVWLAYDRRGERHVAIKVYKSSAAYSAAARKESEILKKIQSTSSGSLHPGSRHIVELLDVFAHLGPHGLHVCLVFEPLSDSLLSLLEQHHEDGGCSLRDMGPSLVEGGLPLELTKEITRQVLLVLDFLHKECGVIHSDIKPENIMLDFPELPTKWDVVKFLYAYSLQEEHEDELGGRTVSELLPSPLFHSFPKDVEGIKKPDFAHAYGADWRNFVKVKLVDFGNACFISDKTPNYHVQTFEYRAPEIFLQHPGWGFPIDIWSTACLFSEMCTAHYLFRNRDGPLDVPSQLELFAESLGPAPDSFLAKCLSSRHYEPFIKNGQLRLLSEELGSESSLTQQMQQFLIPMLRWDPETRPDAMTCANHPFLRGDKSAVSSRRFRRTKSLGTQLWMSPSFKRPLKKLWKAASNS